jgi:hypothetical protein
MADFEMKTDMLDNIHSGKYVAPNVVDCTRCKFAHLDPLPDEATVTRYYEGDYFYTGAAPHSPPDWFAKEQGEYEAGLWDAYYVYLADQLDPTRPVIDWGCGCGWFLDYLIKKRGFSQWQIYGIEPSKTARAFSPVSHRLYASTFNGDGGRGLVKGNVVLALTLEHILNPEKFLRDEVLYHLDGRLVVVVPNEFNLLQKWTNRFSSPDKKNWFVSPVHLNYFTPQTLRGLLERVGLRVTHQGGTFPTEIFCLLGRNHLGNDLQGRANHLWRLEMETRWPGVFRLYGILMRYFNMGREVVMVGEKR